MMKMTNVWTRFRINMTRVELELLNIFSLFLDVFKKVVEILAMYVEYDIDVKNLNNTLLISHTKY